MNETTNDDLERMMDAAARDAAPFASAGYATRAALLERIADRLDDGVDLLVPMAHRETHLTEPRLTGELARTSYQLRLFARLLADGRQLGIEIAHPDPDFPLGAPSPDLRQMRIPLGPVAVFAASNFPFAFSVAGGDTASALAAGCPVIVKAHPGHPELSRATAAVVSGAVAELGLPAGVFGVVFGEKAGVELLRHPALRAASFTGSTAGGRFLFDIAVGRPTPIPFYGELGSVNPVYVTREAMAQRRLELAREFVGSFTLGTGQFCTKPGIVFIPRDPEFLDQVARLAEAVTPAPFLNDRIAQNFERLADDFRVEGVDVLVDGAITSDGAGASLFATDSRVFLEHVTTLSEERFGPSAILVQYDDAAELPAIADAIGGTLTSTVHAQSAHDRDLEPIVAAAVRNSGRIIWNSWPTGVTVSAAMTHGGPYPSTTSPGHTSVGLTAIDRFLRPVTFQGFPADALPPELKDDNPLGLRRSVDAFPG
jgi:NADP-dependent aldehyde dehydrogenase